MVLSVLCLYFRRHLYVVCSEWRLSICLRMRLSACIVCVCVPNFHVLEFRRGPSIRRFLATAQILALSTWDALAVAHQSHSRRRRRRQDP